MFLKRSVALFVLLVCGCTGIFAQTLLKGDDIDAQIQKYVKNISKLIPDSVTTQNIWSYSPRSTGGLFGGGLNVSLTFADQTAVAGTNYEEGGFSGKNADISNFPDMIGFLPAVAFDLRFGGKYFDVGLMGMWADSNTIEQFALIVGEGSNYIHRTIGFDFRLALLTDNVPRFFDINLKAPKILIPGVTFQAGYYFTWMTLGFEAINDEKIGMDFRNDAFFFSLQVSKSIFDLVTPFAGFKMIFAKTFSEYAWNTGDVPAEFRDKFYEQGISYKSGTKEGEFYTYPHFYGGVGISIMMMFDVTVAASYNLVSEHFSVSVGARFLFK